MNNINNLMSLSNACAANKNIISDVLSFEPDKRHSAIFIK